MRSSFRNRHINPRSEEEVSGLTLNQASRCIHRHESWWALKLDNFLLHDKAWLQRLVRRVADRNV